MTPSPWEASWAAPTPAVILDVCAHATCSTPETGDMQRVGKPVRCLARHVSVFPVCASGPAGTSERTSDQSPTRKEGSEDTFSKKLWVGSIQQEEKGYWICSWEEKFGKVQEPLGLMWRRSLPTGWLNKRNLLSHGSGCQKPKIKVLAVLAPSEGCDHLIAFDFVDFSTWVTSLTPH